MNIIVNGKSQELACPSNLENFIKQACPEPKRVIAEVNENIIKRENWSKFELKNDDQIELVTFVGGG